MIQLVLEKNSLVNIEAIKSKRDNLSRQRTLIVEIQVILSRFRAFKVLNIEK